jgi:cobalt-zinc-cadmium efflux system outer membrane protein
MKPALMLAALIACSPGVVLGQDIPLRLSLDEALRLARERHPGIAAARATIAATEGDRQSVSARPNPAITVESSGYPLFESPRPPFRSAQEFTVRIDQEIETAGRRSLRTTIADAVTAGAKASAADVDRQVARDVHRVYLQLMLAVADAKAASEALSEVDQLIALNRVRSEKGEISGADFRRVQLERLRFADDAFGAELALRNARAALLALLGAADLTRPVEPTEALSRPDVTQWVGGAKPASPANVLAEALATRPDIAAIRSEVQRSTTETRLQHALRSPSITLGGGYVHDFGTKAVVFGATVPLPLFNRNAGGVARAEAERARAEASQQLAETTARLEVQQALNALAVNDARVDYIEQQHLANARTVRDIVVGTYRLGQTDLIDVFDAQRTYRDTVRAYNRALYDERFSLSDLISAVGRPGGGR